MYVNPKGARAVCERALKAVSFREEQERFNLWVSLINLEHKYGSGATLKAVSERACQNCNPKKVYLHMAEVCMICTNVFFRRRCSTSSATHQRCRTTIGLV